MNTIRKMSSHHRRIAAATSVVVTVVAHRMSIQNNEYRAFAIHTYFQCLQCGFDYYLRRSKGDSISVWESLSIANE